MAACKKRHLASLALASGLVFGGCIVDTPPIEDTQVPGAVQPTAVPTVAAFEPTEVPAPPTPAAEPTATPVPTATSEPEPTAEPEPAVTPLPTVGVDTDFAPSPVAAGPIAIPVAGVSFELGAQRPILQLSGHTLIYLDDELLAEVDIFTPIADRDAAQFASYDAVIDYLGSDSAFSNVIFFNETTIDGNPAQVFIGNPTVKPDAPERAFYADASTLTSPTLGWYPPTLVQMWVIDAAGGPVIVSAESLEDPGQFVEAVDLAEEILATISFG